MIAKRGASQALRKQAEAGARRRQPVWPALETLSPHGLAKTLPLGWNSWSLFRAHSSDPLIREVADALVTSGMRDAGDIHLNLDDRWPGERDPAGVLPPNFRFPEMKAVTADVHSKGLKLGLRSSRRYLHLRPVRGRL